MTHTSLPFTWGKLCKRPEVSNQKQKEQKYKFVELLIPILHKFISYQFLFYWKGQIMNNHHKIISLHVVLPPIKYERFFLEKKLFAAIQKKGG